MLPVVGAAVTVGPVLSMVYTLVKIEPKLPAASFAIALKSCGSW